MRGLKDFGVVETIYEEDDDNELCSSYPSLSPSVSSSPAPLHSRVELWSKVTGKKADVLIYVEGTCFHLHKDPLILSSYLKRQLTERSQITLPLNITAETFSVVADFCYGSEIVITPFNVAALRTAAELLGMTETNGKRDDNLKQITEIHFSRLIGANKELALIVFRSCLPLLPEAETTAFLLSRCVEALDQNGVDEEIDDIIGDVIGLRAEEFEMVADAMQCRFSSHDLLYRIIDLYIQKHNGEIGEEEKIEICNFIDCDKLSPQFLLHAVQNPSLPLRFIVRAMLIDQLNTRRTFLTTASIAAPQQHEACKKQGAPTLGAILQKDAAKREAAQLKAEMDSASLRIKMLEKELTGMKKLLEKSDKEETSVMSSSRSASFHFVLDNKIERGQRGSTSFAESRVLKVEDERRSTKKSSGGMGLISRLRSRFWASKSGLK